ncbi:MAG: STAS/SEC14 domain-containing protein [Thermodesulfobacteriota bacterium]
MPTIQVDAELSFNQVLNAVKQLSEAERKKLFSQVAAESPLYEDHRLPPDESELLIKINQGIPEKLQRKYNELLHKRDEKTLTNDEYEELLRLTDQMEMLDAKRIEHLTELANIRNKPLVLLMDELGIKPPPPRLPPLE